MQVTVAAVGRDRTGPTRDLFDDYCRRCLWQVRFSEITPRTDDVLADRLAKEAERLLRSVPSGARIIALDEGGQEMGSAAFARQIGRMQEAGATELTFLIGGADGLDPTVLERAELVLALGRMTWPHRLVKVMLAEQLYRASTILRGHPYHRG